MSAFLKNNNDTYTDFVMTVDDTVTVCFEKKTTISALYIQSKLLADH